MRVRNAAEQRNRMFLRAERLHVLLQMRFRLPMRLQNQIRQRINKTMSKEQFKISGEELVAKIKEIIKEGNARRIIIKSEKGETMLEVPLTIGAIGALVAPVLAAVGALAALVTKCTIIVERK